jgi:hypothetical protein
MDGLFSSRLDGPNEPMQEYRASKLIPCSFQGRASQGCRIGKIAIILTCMPEGEIDEERMAWLGWLLRTIRHIGLPSTLHKLEWRMEIESCKE